MHESEFARLDAKRAESYERARAAGLCGLEFDDFGRALGERERRRQGRLTERVVASLLTPVSCVRYFEFDFAAEGFRDRNGGTPRVLDVSSPRLFPFWLAERVGAQVTMINPDDVDRRVSREQSAYVEGPAIAFVDDYDGTTLPFPDASFDAVTSISVIEHIGGQGDVDLLCEMVRVTRPGGTIVLTFPVAGHFESDYRDTRFYPTQQIDPERGAYFFQYFYDLEQIEARFLSWLPVREERRRYFLEDPPGWFAEYEETWIRTGYDWIVNDARFMVEHMRETDRHPSDRRGVCGLALRVDD